MSRRPYPEHIVKDSHKQLYNDFRVFLWYIWKQLALPAPTEVQRDIGAYLQHGPRRRMVSAFRGVGKSFVTAAYVLWRLYRNPQLKILVVSASKERADSFSIFVKRLIGMVDVLRVLSARDGQRDSNLAFDVGPARADQSPSVKSVGITGQMTGSRADLIIADDVEVPKNALTEQQREKLAEAIKEFDAILKPGGEVIFLGTPQTAQSVYNLLPERGYEARVWPARYTQPAAYQGRLAPLLADKLEQNLGLLGRSTEPVRFSDEDLLEREASYGRSGFALQFMLDTSLNDANRYPLKLRDLVVMDLHPERAPVQLTWASSPELTWADLPNVGLNGDRLYRPMWVSGDHTEYQGSVMVIDPAGRGADETAYCVAKLLNGLIFVTAWGGLQGGYGEEALTSLANTARLHHVNKVLVESNFGDGMFLSLLKPVLNRIYPCALEEYRVTGQKELRILDKLEPAMNQHRVVVDRGVLERDTQADDLRYSGSYQLTHVTRDRGSLAHDDRLDALAEAVGYWTRQLQADNEDSERVHRERLHAESLRAFVREATGREPHRGGLRYARRQTMIRKRQRAGGTNQQAGRP